MTGKISAWAGWADDPASSVRDRMSPGLAARCAAADEEFRRAGEREARQRQVRAEQAHERAVLAAAQQKAQRREFHSTWRCGPLVTPSASLSNCVARWLMLRMPAWRLSRRG